MNFSVDLPLLRAYQKAGGTNQTLLAFLPKSKRDEDTWGYRHNSEIKSDFIEDSDLEILIKVGTESSEWVSSQWNRKELRKMRAILALKKSGGKRIVNLELMKEALRIFLRPLPHHWIFLEVENQHVPWFVEDIQFHAARSQSDRYHPAFVEIEMIGKYRGRKVTKTIRFERGILADGINAAALCDRLGIIPENKELIEKHEEEVETYEDYISLPYEQFMASGKGDITEESDDEEEEKWSRRWNRKVIDFEKDGGSSKCIMDDAISFGRKGEDTTVYADESFWVRTKDDDEYEQLREDGVPVFAPLQPYVCVFSLGTHEFAEIHVTNLKPYDYDKALPEKLVLPEDHRRLIDVLISTSHKDAEDIVRGKKGGVVILCSGSPGTGKTLTAEVYAEIAERPLYAVQCSQLGTDADSLEKQLGKVLRRATRWNGVLLIDEADVYIHERGSDVQQNAIVGVFLRLLEYYSGILFLTTNRETVTDDAIMSRCLAHVRYKIPDEESRTKIWQILSTQYNVKLDDLMIKKLVQLFPTISGRSIKQLCRLVQTMEEVPSIKLFKWLASFQDGVVIAGGVH